MNNNVKTRIASNECTDYLYVVDGVIHELTASVACRRAGKAESVVMKQIKCPYCTECLTKVDRDTRIRLYRKPNNKPIKAFPGQYIKRCNCCKGEVGIVMV